MKIVKSRNSSNIPQQMNNKIKCDRALQQNAIQKQNGAMHTIWMNLKNAMLRKKPGTIDHSRLFT